MKKLIVVTLLTLMIFGAANAEPIYGLRGGFNFSNLVGERYTTEEKLGFHAGFMGTYELHPNFVIQPELLFTQRGSYYEGANTTISYILNYLELPIMLKLNFSVIGLKLQPYWGPEFRYLLSAKRKTEAEPNSNTYDIKDSYHVLDYGPGLGIDMIYENFLIGVRYSRGMRKVYKKPSFGSRPDRKNSSLMINLGAVY